MFISPVCLTAYSPLLFVAVAVGLVYWVTKRFTRCRPASGTCAIRTLSGDYE